MEMTELSLDKCICADVSVKGKWYRDHHMKIKLSKFHQILHSQKSGKKANYQKQTKKTQYVKQTF